MRQVTTLAIIEDGNKVLLAMKKRGFGEGWWNGYGGKVNEAETIPDAMVRELQEESGSTATEHRPRGIIEFYFQGSDLKIEMHIFEVTKYVGELIETEEMRPHWFEREDIPYNKMWPGDDRWMPLFFEGKDVHGSATFDSDTKEFISSNFKAH